MNFLLRAFLSCSSFFLFSSSSVFAQNVFWTEDFGTGSSCEQADHPDGFTSSNGTWTVTDNSSGSTANIWYVSSMERGMSAGDCGAGCSSPYNRTAHVGNDPNSTAAGFFCPNGDCGAAYDETSSSEATDKRFESPTIDCSGFSNIELEFLYIMNGEAGVDQMRVYYFDGSSWSLLADPPQTNICGSGQGEWTSYSVPLPASADNNPNVRIGFRWENNGDGTGSDPSVAIDSITLAEPSSSPGPTADFQASDSILCEGDCIDFTDLSSADSIAEWDWQFPGGSPDSSDLKDPSNICYDSAGTYDVTLIITDTSGQKDTLTKTDLIEVFQDPVADAGSDQDICLGDTVQLNGSGGTTYNWTPGDGLSDSTVPDPDAHPSDSMLYQLVVTDSNGCSDSDSVNVNVHHPQADAGPDETICTGDSVQLQASGGGDHIWSPGASLNDSTIADPIADPGDSTRYILTVTDTFGCQSRDTVRVNVLPGANANAGPDRQTGPGDPVSLDGSGSGSFSWEPSGPLDCPGCEDPSATVQESTDFVLTVTNAYGCSATDTMRVIVEGDPTSTAGTKELYIPNVFAPSAPGDAENRKFRVYGGPFKSYHLQVFSRWGEMVFETKDPNEAWKGRYKGEPVKGGVYSYQFKGVLANGREVERSGTVTLLR